MANTHIYTGSSDEGTPEYPSPRQDQCDQPVFDEDITVATIGRVLAMGTTHLQIFK